MIFLLMRTVMVCVPAAASKSDAGPAGAGVPSLAHYLFLRRAVLRAPLRADFLVAFFAPPFLAAFRLPLFFTALRVVLRADLRAPFFAALRVVLRAVLRAPFFAALRAPFRAAFFAGRFFAAFLAAFFAAGFLAAFFFAGFLAAGLAAAGAGAGTAGAAGSSVMLHGNVVSLLIGCSSGWIVDSGPLVCISNGDARRRDPFSHNDSMLAHVFAIVLIAASAEAKLQTSDFGHEIPERP
ncbi:MAG TPA: hypothetical protein VFW60_07685 [Rhodanobacteraceae bacterium]|nr:hypothetical protein [Rhodanobacteraceae bacterium]